MNTKKLLLASDIGLCAMYSWLAAQSDSKRKVFFFGWCAGERWCAIADDVKKLMEKPVANYFAEPGLTRRVLEEYDAPLAARVRERAEGFSKVFEEVNRQMMTGRMEPGVVRCDVCGDGSNSAVGLPCGRVDNPGDEPCRGIYRRFVRSS